MYELNTGGAQMELYQIRYFLKVAETEHMTRAARELNLSEPTLSRTIRQLDLGCLLGNKLRLCRHNSSARSALRKLIPGALTHICVVDLWNDHCLHKSFYEGGFSRSYRADYAEHEGSVCSCGDVLINIDTGHMLSHSAAHSA